VGECFFWYQLTLVVPDKIQCRKTVVCVCACASACVRVCHVVYRLASYVGLPQSSNSVHGSLEARVCISIGPAIFAGLRASHVTNTQTRRQTDTQTMLHQDTRKSSRRLALLAELAIRANEDF